MLNSGDVVLTKVQFTDTFEIKTRPALVLFEDRGNIIVCGITSNKNMEGIRLSKKDGAMKESVIKINYIFTISNSFIHKKLFSLSSQKKKEVFESFIRKLSPLNNSNP